MHDMHVVEDQVPFLSRHFRLVPHSVYSVETCCSSHIRGKGLVEGKHI